MLVIALVSGEGKFEVVEGYYAGWNFNASGHPDGNKIVPSIEDAKKFATRADAEQVMGGDPRLGGAKILGEDEKPVRVD